MKELAALLLLLPASVSAQVATPSPTPKRFSCEPPTLRTDGTSYDAATENHTYRIYLNGRHTDNSATCGYTDSRVLAPGEHSYQIAAYDKNGKESAKTDPVVVAVATLTPTPVPPTPTATPTKAPPMAPSNFQLIP